MMILFKEIEKKYKNARKINPTMIIRVTSAMPETFINNIEAMITTNKIMDKADIIFTSLELLLVKVVSDNVLSFG